MDYNSNQLSNLDRQATIFLLHQILNFWHQHFYNIELQNSLLSNINDDGDNDEKKQKILKLGWEYLKTWVEIVQVGIFWVGIFRVGILQGEFDGWEFSGWEFS